MVYRGEIENSQTEISIYQGLDRAIPGCVRIYSSQGKIHLRLFRYAQQHCLTKGMAIAFNSGIY